MVLWGAWNLIWECDCGTYERMTDGKWKERLKNDMERAYRKTEKYWKRDSWSLYHETGDNLWILNIVNHIIGKGKKARADM